MREREKLIIKVDPTTTPWVGQWVCSPLLLSSRLLVFTALLNETKEEREGGGGGDGGH